MPLSKDTVRWVSHFYWKKEMSKKIESLTPEQIAQIPAWTKKWIDIGLSTGPADFNAATEAALKAYKLCNLEKPMVILRVASPYVATVGGAYAYVLLKTFFWAQVWAQVRAQVRAQEFQSAKDGLNNDGISNLWCAFTAYATFFRDVCGWGDVEILKKLEINEKLVQSCGWTWWHQNVLAISDRPIYIKRDDAGRLHCETGASIEYRDGWSLYNWHGVTIPKEWVIGKKPTASEALNWSNLEQRRAACEIVGWANILQELDAKVIDSDDDPEIGTLLECELPDSGKERFLQVKCATGRNFCLHVPNEMKTALEAQAWMFQVDVKDFIPPQLTA